jgi:surface antigen
MNQLDPWLFYKRNCTSYVAWKINEAGKTFSNGTGGGQFGNAENWDDNAQAIGWTVSATPRVRSVGVKNGPGSSLGHVAWVEKVNASGTVKRVRVQLRNYRRVR